MSTYTQILYQLVWSTKHRRPVLISKELPRLYKYIAGIIRNHGCRAYAIGGVEDHLHIVLFLHPSVALSNLVKDIKIASSIWIKENDLFSGFDRWQDGYSAFTYSIEAKANLVKYVDNQVAHHKRVSSKEELVGLLQEHKASYDLKYLV